MARGRKSPEAGDSLDLLLDTICNTFGGVLFMAMLICLLSGGPARQKLADEQAAASEQLDVLAAIEQRERTVADAETRLREAEYALAAAQAEAKRISLLHGIDRDRVTELAVQFTHDRQTVHEAMATTEVVAQINDETAADRTSLANAQREQARLQQELARVQESVREARERSKVQLRLPAARESHKRQVVAYVWRNRMYAGVYPDVSYRFHPFYRGSVSASIPDTILPTELPSSLGSTEIDSVEKARTALTLQGLDKLVPRDHYVMFAVWPDSHEAFRFLRDELSSRGVGYGLLLMEVDARVSFGGGGGYEQ